MSLSNVLSSLCDLVTKSKKSPRSKSAFCRLELERLEQRDVPTIVFTPHFGAETVSGQNVGMISPNVDVIFSGPYWSTPQAHQNTAGVLNETNVLNSIRNIIRGPYLSGLTQYGADGKALLANHWDESGNVPGLPSANGPSGNQVQQYLQSSIANHNADPGQNDVRHAPIYIVVSDPNSSTLPPGTTHYARGWNALGTYNLTVSDYLFGNKNLPKIGSHTVSESMHMIWLRTSTTTGWKDTLTSVVSHELAEAISDPNNADPNGGITVRAPAGWTLGGDNQICDNEPDDSRYDYRLGNDLVQAYWSRADNAFIVPDKTWTPSQQSTYYDPIWSGTSFSDNFNIRFQRVLPTTVGRLNPYEGLAPGDSIKSQDGRFTLIYQTDGNLVLYAKGGYVLWASNTNGKSAGVAYLQGGGNLAVYDSTDRLVWATGTGNHPDAWLAVQNDGNLVINDANGHSLWSSNTTVQAFQPTRPAVAGRMSSGQGLTPGQTLTSADGRYSLIFQQDSNLVCYGPSGNVVWASNTNGRAGWNVVMQADGNLVMHDPRGSVLWASNTAGHPGASLSVQNDGTLDIYDASGYAVWASNPVILFIGAGRVSFKTYNSYFLCAESGGGREVNATRTAAGAWETFTVVSLGGNKVALRASNGQYVSAENGGGGAVNANRNSVGVWETFTVVNAGSGKIALQTYNGHYLCAENGGGGVLNATRTAFGAWESFLFRRM